MFGWLKDMFRVPFDTELWPESDGAGYSPNESNGVLGRPVEGEEKGEGERRLVVHDSWSVAPSLGVSVLAGGHF